MFLPFSTLAQTSKNISLGSSLTALKDGDSSWPSPSGEFAFGFREVAKDGFLLAIWFDEIPNKTIVWSANRDNLVPKGSKVELTVDGEFILNDATGKRIWYTQSAGSGVAYASMLDTGNFVLANRSSSYVWESFSHPTDTILPSQTLNQNGILYARYTATNYSTGRFLFSLQPDGNLVLATTNFPQDTLNEAYWSVENPNTGFRFIFNESGFMYVTSKNGSLLSTISSTMVSMKDFYQRATLEYNGVFRHYVYPKNTSSSSGRWDMAWSTSSYEPPNICTSIMESRGGGASKLLRIDQTLTMTGIRGTKGYVAPEWFKRLPITAKVDIYSYGILLLEIIFCRKHFDAAVEDEGPTILADWAYDCYKQNQLHQLFKNNDEAMHDMKMVEKYVMIAIWCIQEDPSLRPNMKKVTLMLEGTVEVSAPPDPSSFISSIL
ncbi:hypothetical protein C1H46_024616 [Malus baccata]|uniref:Bulb-type lectin domain-containing protein n=1 Tax=Malus baccata TaxID=106549 RepID=A0A540LTL7_MALBA|nr:hypothetical protein C1H46_024616 [Malus baccata]